MKNKTDLLNAELAKELLGWKHDHTGLLWVDPEDVTHFDGPPSLSTTWAGAGEVLDAMAALGYDYEVTLRKGHLVAYFITNERSSGFGCSPPDLAYVVAASALRALQWRDELREEEQ